MANGNGPCVRCYALLGLVIVVILAVTGVWNPFPRLWTWVNQSQPLSTPAPAWQQRLGSMAKSVTIVGTAVVVEHRTTVEALSLQAGIRLWQADADWAAVAGTGDSAVVVAGELLVKGYDVLDPVTGRVLRRDREAVAVWTYRNLLLDLRCLAARDCQLRAWDPRGGRPLWTVPMPGSGFVLFADNPELPTTRPLSAARVNADAGGPGAAPGLLGFRADGKVHVVDTAAGRVVQVVDPPRGERLVVVGGRVLTVSARAQDGTCYFTTVASDPIAGREVWRQDGLNLRTVDGAGCAQRDDPAGGRNVVLGVLGEGREVLVDAYDGRALWRGRPGERTLAVDDRFAVVRAPDNRSVTGYGLGRPGPGWRRDTPPDVQAALTPYAALLLGADPPRVVAVHPADATVLLELRSTARVLAVGPAGLLLGEGRDLAYLRFAGAAADSGAPPPAPAATTASTAPAGPCGGAKQPSCPTPAGR